MSNKIHISFLDRLILKVQQIYHIKLIRVIFCLMRYWFFTLTKKVQKFKGDDDNHTRTDGRDFYWTLMPTWNNELLKGVNSISSPSVLAFKREKVTERFDENLSMMMDCEMYYRLDKVHGQPVYLHDDLISNRVHDEQISMQKYKSKGFAEFMKNEVRHCYEKHDLHDKISEVDELSWNWS